MALWSADPALAPGIRRRLPGWLVAAAEAASRRAAQGAPAGLRGGCWPARPHPFPLPAGPARPPPGGPGGRPKAAPRGAPRPTPRAPTRLAGALVFLYLPP